MSNTILTFSPFTLQNFLEFREKSINDYTQNLVESGKGTHSAALEEAAKGFDGMLPQGLDTPNHSFNYIQSEQGEKIGYIWYDIRNEDVFICEFRIYEDQQGKGFARQTLDELEQIARIANVPMIRLHVFEHDTELQEFYRHMGFEISTTRPGSCWMQKVLR